jgi:hypothetical protein
LDDGWIGAVFDVRCERGNLRLQRATWDVCQKFVAAWAVYVLTRVHILIFVNSDIRLAARLFSIFAFIPAPIEEEEVAMSVYNREKR